MSDDSENPDERPIAVGDRVNCASEPTTSAAVGSPSCDDAGSAVADPGRQHVLRCLARAETPMALADLADELVRRTTGRSPTAAQDERERLYVSLYHWHLPKLAEAGLVSVDNERNLVDLRADADELPVDAGRTSADGRRNGGSDDGDDR